MLLSQLLKQAEKVDANNEAEGGKNKPKSTEPPVASRR